MQTRKQEEIEEVKGWIREWIQEEREGLTKQSKAPKPSYLSTQEIRAKTYALASYWNTLIKSVMVEGTVEELIKTKVEAIKTFKELGKSHKWIERYLYAEL
jgi:hypothetical protein